MEIFHSVNVDRVMILLGSDGDTMTLYGVIKLL